MIVVDASVLIAHFDANDIHHVRAEALLLGASSEQLSASPITIAEVLVGPAKTGQREQATAAIATLGVQVVALSDDAPLRLAMLRAESGLKMPDCCVLLAAHTSNAQVATFDIALANVARRRGLLVADG